MRILLLSRSLDTGGAERQLIAMAKGLHERGHSIGVALFYSGGRFQDELKKEKIWSASPNKKGRWDIFPFYINLIKIIRNFNPQYIYSFLGPANIMALLVKPFVKNVKVIWGVRASNMDLSRYDWLSRLSYRIECRLSGFADLIISNSNSGLRHAIKNGFPAEKLVVVPNGINTAEFHLDPFERERLRLAWNIQKDDILIGLVGRLDPMKGHPVFIKAAALLAQKYQNLRFACVGKGPVIYRNELQELATAEGLSRKLIWVEEMENMTAVYNGLDILGSSSVYGEGFSNVIGEAMACGTPCVVTDIGDSAMIVRQFGVVVPANDPDAFSKGLEEMLGILSGSNRDLIRRRIVNHFSLQKLVENTENILCNIIK